MGDETLKESESDKTDPGASKFGNFINYYQFHPPVERLQQLPRGIWTSSQKDDKFLALDIGCNAGDLTVALYSFLRSEHPDETEVSVLGIDLDEILIERAKEKNAHPNNVSFQCLDFFDETRDEMLRSYLSRHNRSRFDVVYAFSITMWIHLNHGDAGLEHFLETICSFSELVVIEPQPWKCYGNAARRLRRAKEEGFPLLETLSYRKDIEQHIEDILQRNGFDKVLNCKVNNWRRKLLLYKRRFE